MASDTDTAQSLIETQVNTNWPTISGLATSTIAWPGRDFTKPNGVWLRVTTLWGDANRYGMGSSGGGTVSGVLVLNVFNVPGSGYGTIGELADDLRDLFDGVTVGSVEFLEASGPRQSDADPAWLQLTISVPFLLEENS